MSFERSLSLSNSVGLTQTLGGVVIENRKGTLKPETPFVVLLIKKGALVKKVYCMVCFIMDTIYLACLLTWLYRGCGNLYLPSFPSYRSTKP
jgi:hypothetical protein